MSVLVFTENWDGKFKKLSFELVSYASKLAEIFTTSAIALTFGAVSDDELKKLGKYGVAKIIKVNGDGLNVLDTRAWVNIMSDIAEKENVSLVILSNNITGKAIAPRLSVRMKAGLGSGVSGLPISTEPFVVYKKVYSGNAFANVLICSEKKIITLSQNSFELIEKPGEPEIVSVPVTLEQGLVKTQVKEVQKQSGKILLTDAEIVVSGGRGMKSPDNWGPLVELAELLGAATACSRPVSDEGWRPHEEHTGQTGKIIAPNLYLAIGISGATQHLAGVSSSKCIAAINTDKDAPIFEAARYGIVGDAAKILPKLIDAVKEIKGK
jgi:electron transfer flavoprotein alpha subunit